MHSLYEVVPDAVDVGGPEDGGVGKLLQHCHLALPLGAEERGAAGGPQALQQEGCTKLGRVATRHWPEKKIE